MDFFVNVPDSGSPSWKDPVADASLLPATGNQIGDARIATDTETLYSWNGTSWVVLATVSESLAITALNGDVSATGPGVATATVNFVGGVSAANVALGANAANAATPLDTPNTIVERNGSGNFAASVITATNLIDSGLTANTALIANGSQQISSSTTTSTELSYVHGVTSPIQTQINSIAGSGITALTGDGTATGPGSVPFTLATVNSNTGSFGSSTSIPNFTVNGKGLITSAGSNAVIAPAGTLSGTTLNSTVVNSSLTSVGTITSGVWNGTTIAIANGGTGQTSTSAAFNALAPTTLTGGLIYGNGTNTYSNLPIGTSSQILTVVGGLPSWQNSATSGTVTSVALALPGSVFAISGSPVTSTGTLTGSFTNQNPNTFFSGPSSGGANLPTFRLITPTDVPTLNQNTTGTAANITATSNSTLTTLSALSLPGTQVTGNISGNAGNITATSNSTLTTLTALSLPGSQVTGNISGNAANITATTNNTLTSLPSLVLPTSQLSGTISLTTQVSGVLPSANGGTGVNNSFNLTIGGTSSINGTVTGSNSGDITLTAVGSTPNANAASLSGQVLNLQPASASFPGVVSTTTQSFAGNKTFTGNTTSTNLTINGTAGSGFIQMNTQSATPTTPVGGIIMFADATNRWTTLNTNGFTATWDTSGITANRIYTTRDVSGKILLDSRLSYAGFTVTTTPYTILSTDAYAIYFINTSTSAITINLPAISAVSDRVYIFKDISGNAEVNNITIVPSGTNTIEGLNVGKIYQTNFGGWTLISDTVSGWWMI